MESLRNEEQSNIAANRTRYSRRAFLNRAVLTSVGVAVVPLLIDTDPANAGLFSTASPDEQKKVGEQASRQILQQYHEVHDGRATHFQQLGRRLVNALPDHDRKTWDYQFHVLDSKEVNAFALPGGHMFMYTGLYSQLATDDALAGVTGHEMTHVRLQHWAKANAQQQERSLGLGILLSLFHAGNSAQTIAQLADSAVTLKYSRNEENQADAGGLDNMVAAGYNPYGMIQLFNTLEKLSGNGGSFAGAFLSDHPLTSDRIKQTEARIAALHHTHSFPPFTPLHYNSL